MTFEGIISYIVSLLIYTGLFCAVLTWLKIKEKRVSRGFFLAGVLILAEIAAPLVAGFTSEAIVRLVVGTTVIIVVFYLVVRKLLVLKTWQHIAIPLGVSIVGHVIQAVLLMFYFNAISGNT